MNYSFGFQVIAIIGLHGACRSDELYKLQVGNFDDRQSVMVVSLLDTKTKKDRSFCITEKKSGDSFLETIRKYIALRPHNVQHDKFFINYRQQKCTVQPVGINTIYKIPQKIAEFLKLPNPEMYTGHCFRRSAATMVADSGADLVTVKRLGGWQSSSVAETYIEESVTNKIAVSKCILNNVEHQTVDANVANTSALKQNSSLPVCITGNVNCNINIYTNSKDDLELGK